MTTNPPLIGLCGYAQVGKDTVGAVLTEAHGYERRAFADKLRELALAADPYLWNGDHGLHRYRHSLEYLGYEGAKERNPEVRDFLVRLGAGARRLLGRDVWLDATLPVNAGGVTLGGAWVCPATVVTDVRYLNEAQRIADLGGEVWYISRPGYEAANEEEQRSIAEILQHGPRMRWFVNDHALVDLPYVVSRFLAHDAD